MGMYDTICGEQVKCFYVPVCHVNGDGEASVYTMGGMLNVYSIGDEVPSKTKYYDYGRDYNIILEDNFMKPVEITIITIRDSKVVKVCLLAETTSNDWKGINHCVSNYGDILAVDNADKAREYVEEKAIVEYKRINFYKNNMPANNKSMELLFGIAGISEEERKRRMAEYDSLQSERELEEKEYERLKKEGYSAFNKKFIKYVPDPEAEMIGLYEAMIDILTERIKLAKEDKDWIKESRRDKYIKDMETRKHACEESLKQLLEKNNGEVKAVEE